VADKGLRMMDDSQSSLDGFGDDRIGALLAMAQRVAFNCYNALLDHLHLTPGQAEILNLLAQRETVAVGMLAEMYRVKPPVMTAMVDELVRLALVERRADPGDRRRSILMATEKGQQTMRELSMIRDRMQSRLTANLSEQEVVQLSTSLKKVIRSLEGNI
jgi:DNA-binding MarR family transcriptional regulator